jgi:hypothetical protein
MCSTLRCAYARSCNAIIHSFTPRGAQVARGTGLQRSVRARPFEWRAYVASWLGVADEGAGGTGADRVMVRTRLVLPPPAPAPHPHPLVARPSPCRGRRSSEVGFRFRAA